MNTHITQQSFACYRDHFTIRGTEYLPEGDHLPAIIVSHGFGGNSKELEQECHILASWGYAVYSFDFCGGCANEKGKSDGKTTDMTVLTECEDLRAVMKYVQALSTVDASRLTLIGFSQGGLISALTAAQYPDEVEALILFFPALCIPDHARKGALANASYDINDVPEVIDCGNMLLGKAFHDTVVHMNPFQEINSYKGPVWILHGTADELVDYRYSIQARQSYEPGQCHVQLIKDAGHGFTQEQMNNAFASMYQFILDKKEILTIQVQITGTEIRKEEGVKRQIAILFTGNCDTPFFKGHILPGAEDVQDYIEDKLINIRAEYSLAGVDREGKPCSLHIVNQNINREWKPVVTTSSRSLSFLNKEDLTAVLEGFAGGLTVRIFSKI